MKAVFVLHSHNAGGAERHLVQLVQNLTHRGVKCIFAGPLDGWLGKQLQSSGIQCEQIAFHGFYDLISFAKLVQLLRRERPDFVHGHLTRGAYYAGWAGKVTSTPCVATGHSTNAGKHFGRAQRIIAVSDAVRRFLSETGYPESILRTVHNGVPDKTDGTNEWRKITKEQWNLGDAPVIAMVARFEKVKGHDIALRALAKLKHRDWNVLFAGATNTVWASQMKKLAEELGIANRVQFLGHIDDVERVYSSVDIVVAPSRREALSLTLLEAASFSIPIVAADVGGIGEAVLDKESGLLVPAEDADALALALEQMIIDADLRVRLGRKGRRHYEENFSIDTMADKTITVYRELISVA